MAVEHIAKLLHSNDFVDRGSDDGEVEPIRSADIAVQHFTDVECDVDLGEGQPFRLAPQVPRLDLFQALHRGLEAAIAGDPLLDLLERYCGQHRVADEFEDMAATGPQRGRQRLKGLVQHLDDLRARGHVADPREASQIRVPQHRVETVDSSALDRAGVNARARVVPKIGPQKSGGDVIDRREPSSRATIPARSSARARFPRHGTRRDDRS